MDGTVASMDRCNETPEPRAVPSLSPQEQVELDTWYAFVMKDRQWRRVKTSKSRSAT
jgi:hypothetical protein